MHWIEQQEQQIHEGSYTVSSKITMSKKSAILGYDEFVNSFSNLIRNNKKVVENNLSSIQLSCNSKENNSVEFSCVAELAVKSKFLKIFSMHNYKIVTRQITISIYEGDIRISLHDKSRNKSEYKDEKKRKFRFYVRKSELNERFMLNCLDYLLFKTSNHDIIKCIPHISH